MAAEHAVDGEVLGYAREAAQLYFDVLRRPEDAVGLLRRALSFAPDGKELKQRLAEGLRSAGELDEAQTLLSELVEAFGRRASEERAAVHLQLARVLHRKGDMDQAIENLEMASRMDHNDVTVLRTLAELSREGGQLDRAERAYRSLLLKLRRSSSSSLPPVSSDGEAPVSAAEVMLELGRIAADRGQADKAEELTASALDALAQDDGDAPR